MMNSDWAEDARSPTYKHLHCAMTSDIPVDEFEDLIQNLLLVYDTYTVLRHLAEICGRMEVIEFMIRSEKMIDFARVISKTIEQRLQTLPDTETDRNLKKKVCVQWGFSVKDWTEHCVDENRLDLARMALEWYRQVVSVMKRLDVPDHQEYENPKHGFGPYLLTFIIYQSEYEDPEVLKLFADYGHIPDFRVWHFSARHLGIFEPVRRSSLQMVEERSGYRYDENELKPVRLIED